MNFLPEDGKNAGPHCRNCHTGSNDCSQCHGAGGNAYESADKIGASEATFNGARTASGAKYGSMPKYDPIATPGGSFVNGQWVDPATNVYALAKNPFVGKATYTFNSLGNFTSQADGEVAKVMDSSGRYGTAGDGASRAMHRSERTVAWPTGTNSYRTSGDVTVAADCGNDGFSWPHRTLGWKLLRDQLFGIDVTAAGETTMVVSGQTPSAGSIRHGLGQVKVWDLDSVCLDCHNPNIWNPDGNYADELMWKGLP